MQNENLCRMEIKGYKEPHMIDCRNPPDLWIYVVMGDTDHAGCVKPVKVGFGQLCPFLKYEWAIDGEQNRYLREVRIPLSYAKRGWFLLDRAYDEEGNEHGKKQWHDFQKACKRHRAFAAKGDQRIVPGFPDELLPQAVRDCVKRRDKKLEAWKPEMPAEEPKRGRAQESRT